VNVAVLQALVGISAVLRVREAQGYGNGWLENLVEATGMTLAWAQAMLAGVGVVIAVGLGAWTRLAAVVAVLAILEGQIRLLMPGYGPFGLPTGVLVCTLLALCLARALGLGIERAARPGSLVPHSEPLSATQTQRAGYACLVPVIAVVVALAMTRSRSLQVFLTCAGVGLLGLGLAVWFMGDLRWCDPKREARLPRRRITIMGLVVLTTGAALLMAGARELGYLRGGILPQVTLVSVIATALGLPGIWAALDADNHLRRKWIIAGLTAFVIGLEIPIAGPYASLDELTIVIVPTIVFAVVMLTSLGDVREAGWHLVRSPRRRPVHSAPPVGS
jgi:hypothetical protein